jgi:hypothetical protein
MAMKEIVVVCLAADAKTGALIPDAPFLVEASRSQRDRAESCKPAPSQRLRLFAPWPGDTVPRWMSIM